MKNNDNKTADEISESQEIKHLILEKVPEYLWQVLKDQNLFERLDYIIRNISPYDLNRFVNHPILGREKSPLEYVLEFLYRQKDTFSLDSNDQESVNLVKTLVERTSLLHDPIIIKYIVEVFNDKEFIILEDVLRKINAKELAQRNPEDLYEPLMHSFETKKYEMMTKLLNYGAVFPKMVENTNLLVISKAVNWGFEISKRDIEIQYNYEKIRLEDLSNIFHLIAKFKDNSLLEHYKDLIKEFAKIENINGESPLKIALKNKYVEFLEIYYENENLYDSSNKHLLIDDPKLKVVSKYLKETFNLDVSISEAIHNQISINEYYDKKGNSIFYSYFKRIILETNKEKYWLNQINDIFGCFKSIDFTKTKRDDKNTVLHLLAGNGSLKLINIVLKKIDKDLLISQVRNKRGLNPLEYGEMYGHIEACNSLRNKSNLIS